LKDGDFAILRFRKKPDIKFDHVKILN